jgi:hypothetical protein
MAKTGGSKRISITQQAIATAQIKAGDIAGAQKTLTVAQETVDFFQEASPWSKIEQLDNIITAQINAGDITGAQKTLASAQQVAAHMPATNPSSSAMEKSITNLINISINSAKIRIAKAQAEAGDHNTPDSTHPLKPDTTLPVQLIQPIAVTDWLKMLDDDRSSSYYDKDRAPLNTEPFLDLACHLKFLPPSDDPQKVFKALHEAAKAVVSAQNVITEMLTQQAKR